MSTSTDDTGGHVGSQGSPISTSSSTSKRFLNALRIPSFQPRSASVGTPATQGPGHEIPKESRGTYGRRIGTTVITRSASDGQYVSANGLTQASDAVKRAKKQWDQRHPTQLASVPPSGSPLPSHTSPSFPANSLPTLKTLYRFDDLPELLRPADSDDRLTAANGAALLPPIDIGPVERTIRAPSRSEHLNDGNSTELRTMRSGAIRPVPSDSGPISTGVTTMTSSSTGKRRSLFDMSWNTQKEDKAIALASTFDTNQAAVRRSREGLWLISVNLEAKKRKKGSENGEIDYARDRLVVYASAPTGQYTLFRDIKDVIALHLDLEHTLPEELPPLPSILIDHFGLDLPARKERRPSFLNNFQNRWRFTMTGSKGASTKTAKPPPLRPTLPNRDNIGSPQSMLAIGPFEFERATEDARLASELSSALDLSPPKSTFRSRASYKSVADENATIDAQVQPEDSLLSRSSQGKLSVNRARHQILTAISQHLSSLANDPKIRASSTWRSFFRARKYDLASVHTSERVGEGWMDISKTTSGSPLIRTASTAAKDRRQSSLRKSKSFGNGILAGQPQKALPHSPIRSSLARGLPIQAGSPDGVVLIERPPAAPRPMATEDDELRKATKLAGIPALPQAADMAQSPSGDLSHERMPVADDTRRSQGSPSAKSPSDSATADTVQAPLPEVIDPADDNPPARTPTFGRHSRLFWRQSKSASRVAVRDFELIRVLGRGCAGKVVLVRHRGSGGLFAMKAIVKRHSVALQELQHTLTEQSVLKRLAMERAGDPSKNPFLVKLWWSFHDDDNLYLVLDFHPGGDLATQLARWGRLGKDRARFYTCEIVEGVECLHASGVIYRDLKPENALLGADGHIVLVDFGLAAEFPGSQGPLSLKPQWMSDSEPRPSLHHFSSEGAGPLRPAGDTATSFVGTAEYLAPEILRAEAYSYEVDWWSLGTMLYEALLGTTPFWADNTNDMYARVLHEELTFPNDRNLDRDTRSFLRGLLQKDPCMRLTEPRIKSHPYLSMLDWEHVRMKRYIPPYIPPQDPDLEYDIQNFDDAFLSMGPTLDDDSPRSPRLPAEGDRPDQPIDHSAFDGYTFCDQNLISAVFEEDVLEKPATPQDITESGPETADAIPDGSKLVALEAIAVPPAEPQKINGIPEARAPTPAPPAPAPAKASRQSRELSGIDALDRGLSLTPTTSNDTSDGTDTEAELGDEWDLIDEDQQVARNGRRVRDTLFARGVVDRYRLAVLRRKESSLLKHVSSKLKRSPSSSLFLSANGVAGPTLSSHETPADGAPFSSLGTRMARLRLRNKKDPIDPSAEVPEILQVNEQQGDTSSIPQRSVSGSTGRSHLSGGRAATVIDAAPPPVPEKEEATTT